MPPSRTERSAPFFVFRFSSQTSFLSLAKTACKCAQHSLADALSANRRIEESFNSSRALNQHAFKRKVCLDDETSLIHRDVTDESELVQAGITFDSAGQIELGSPQLFILHFEFDLMDLQFVNAWTSWMAIFEISL